MNRLIAFALGVVLALAAAPAAVANGFVAIAYAPDSKVLAAGWTDGRNRHELRFFRAGNGALLSTIRTGRPVIDLAYSADGKLLAALQVLRGGRSRVEVFDLDTGQSLRSMTTNAVSVFGHDQLALLGSVDTVAVARAEKPSLLWNYDSRKSTTLSGWTYGVAVNRLERMLAYGDGALVRLRRVADGKLVRTFETRSEQPVVSLAYGDRGTKIAAGRGPNLEIWSPQGKRLRVLPAPDFVRGAAFQANGMRVAMASWNNPILVFNARSGRRLHRLMADATDWYEDVAITPRGARIAGLTVAGEIRVWNGINGDLLHTLR